MYRLEQMKRLAESVESAAMELANTIVENDVIYWDFLKNATDFNEVFNQPSGDVMIEWMINRANNREHIDTFFNHFMELKPFSIQEEWDDCYHHEEMPVIDELVENHLEDYLDEYTIECINDYIDIGGILGSDELMGGSYETFRDFQSLVLDNVLNKIKENINQ
jgi:hypothetical protein